MSVLRLLRRNKRPTCCDHAIAREALKRGRAEADALARDGRSFDDSMTLEELEALITELEASDA